ncbi:unnamed protein product, partial [Rotaria magnacalcarata]
MASRNQRKTAGHYLRYGIQHLICPSVSLVILFSELILYNNNDEVITKTKFLEASKDNYIEQTKCGVPRPDQTRPILLLATHSKVFEKVLLERVSNWAEGAR